MTEIAVRVPASITVEVYEERVMEAFAGGEYPVSDGQDIVVIVTVHVLHGNRDDGRGRR